MKTVKDAEPLFNVLVEMQSTYTRNSGNGKKYVVNGEEQDTPFYTRNVLMTQKDLDSRKMYAGAYPREKIISTESIKQIWPNPSVIVEHLGSSDRGWRCYSEASYSIKSDTRLTEEDMDILRAQNCFMGGQECGSVNLEQFDIKDGLYCYTARSVCDSSD